MVPIFDRIKSKLGHSVAKSSEPAGKSGKEDDVSSDQEPDVKAAHGLSLADYPELDLLAVHQQFYRQIFSCDIDESRLSDERKSALIELATRLLDDETFRQKSTPRLPAVVPQLLRCLNDKTAGSDDAVKLIKQDPTLAAGVLKTANSAFFNPNNKVIDSFQRAVVILGTQGLRSLLCTTMLQPITSDKRASKYQFGKQLWAHSLRTGISAQLIAARHQGDPFLGYLSGLFHGIGEITLFSQLSSWEFDDDAEMASAFYFIQQISAPALSAAIIRQWQLPDEIAAVVLRENDQQMGLVLPRAAIFSQAIHLLQAGDLSGEQLNILMQLHGISADICGKVIEMTAQMQAS